MIISCTNTIAKEPEHDASHPPKRLRTAASPPKSALALTTSDIVKSAAAGGGLAEPTLLLQGHTGSVYALSYSPDGHSLASASFDCKVLIWGAFGYCTNYAALSPDHRNAVLDVQWTPASSHLVTAGADGSLAYYDARAGTRVRRLLGHEGVVNAVSVPRGASAFTFASGGDDGTLRIWDVRVPGGRGTRANVATARAREDPSCPVAAVAVAADSMRLYAGGVDEDVTCLDLRKLDGVRPLYRMSGHGETVTGLEISPDGNSLLSHGIDGTMREWDVRNYVPDGSRRMKKSFVGAKGNAERGLLKCGWNFDGTMVSGGSADRVVRVWDEMTAEELYSLPGHKGCVNCIAFHPSQNMIASGSSDKNIYVGELS